MSGGKGGHADNVHVVLYGLPCGFLRGCEQRADIDIEAKVGERRRDDFLAAIVAVLPDFGDQNARLAAFVLGEFLHLLLYPRDGVRDMAVSRL